MERKVGPRPATKDFLKSKKPIRVTHEIVDDNEWSQRLTEAKVAVELAQAKWTGLSASIDAKIGAAKTEQAEQAEQARADYDAAVAEHDELRAEADEHVMVLVFRAIGGHQLDLLNRTHRPTESDREEAKAQGMTDQEIRQMEHSPSTFPPVLIAASLVEPKLTEDEVKDLIWDSDAFNEAERLSVLMKATMANGQLARVPDLGPTFGALPAPSTSSGSPTASDALAPSS